MSHRRRDPPALTFFHPKKWASPIAHSAELQAHSSHPPHTCTLSPAPFPSRAATHASPWSQCVLYLYPADWSFAEGRIVDSFRSCSAFVHFSLFFADVFSCTTYLPFSVFLSLLCVGRVRILCLALDLRYVLLIRAPNLTTGAVTSHDEGTKTTLSNVQNKYKQRTLLSRISPSLSFNIFC